MTNPARPPNHPAVQVPPAALAATALATPQQRPAEPMRTSAPGFTPVPQQPQHAAPAPPHAQPGRAAPAPAAAPAAASGLPSSKRPDPYLGTTFDGRYQIEKRLGEGGMGVVYSARHTMIGKRVAVKVLRNEYAQDRDILDRFVQEARTASSIGNPHIVDISDFGTLPDGATYFVMELLEGESLTDIINPTGSTEPARIDPVRICKVALQLCDGLGAAHARDIVHRDLKPDNIFLVKKGEPDFVKILDFGIAKVTNTATQKTRAGQVFGTPHYMSPEQASGRGVDARSDIYSVGVILYEMATGRLPFTDETYMGILTAHMYRSPEPIRSLPGLETFPVGLDAIIQKCLAKHLELRYQNMGQLDADLRRALQNQEPEAVTSLLTQTNATEGTGVLPGVSSRMSGLSATPAPRRGASTVIIGAGLIAAVGLVAGALYLKKKLNADVAAPTATVAEAATTAAPIETAEKPASTPASAAAPVAPISAAPAASASSAAPATVHVVLKVVPATAKLSIDGNPIEKNEIDVDPAHPVSVKIEAVGFLPQTVPVDGKQAEVATTLTRLGAVPPAPLTGPTAKPSSTTPPGIIPSWGKKSP
ncbi:MAG: serine/threonine-protein kinase [Polyangiaceae bacterium]